MSEMSATSPRSPKGMDDKSLGAFIDKWNKKQPRTGRVKTALSEERATIRIQSFIRMLKYRIPFRKYLKRARPVRELYTTEKTYVEILDAVVNHFLLPMTNEKVADPSQIRTIFSNVQIIFMLNSTLLSDMEERIKIWDSEQIIGDIFIQITDFLKVYIDYVSSFPESSSTLAKLLKTDSDIKKWIDSQMSKLPGHEGESLQSLLITPVQRIPRYNLLLSEILKNTSNSHPDFDLLERATSKVREVALYVNERTREAENLAKVYSIQNMLGSKIDVLGPNRKIVREGFLKQIYGNKGKKRPVYCVLFNDIIICCKVETKILTGTQKFECLEKIPLLDCAITQLVDDESKGHRNAFNVETRKAKLTLVSPSLSDREKWCKKLNRCAKDTLEKNKFYEDSKETVASQRAGEARALIAQKYTHYRVKGRDATTDGSCDPGVPGVRKFAERKKHFNSLTPVEKLDRTAVALEETDELLKEELRILEEREKEAEEKAGRVKESINRRYNTQNTSDDTSLDSSRTELVPPSNLRNWTLKRSPRPKDSSESELDRLETSSSESGSRIEKEKNEKEKEERSKRKSAKKFLSLKVGSLKQNEEKNSPPVPARILLEADEEKQRIAQEKAAKAKEAITQIYSADGKYEAESTESGGATPTEGDPQLRSWKKHNTLTRKTPNPNL